MTIDAWRTANNPVEDEIKLLQRVKPYALGDECNWLIAAQE